MGNDAYCYPLTVTDHASRYLHLTVKQLSERWDLSTGTLDHWHRYGKAFSAFLRFRLWRVAT